ncbi:MAG: TIGR03619 family F420-dependent LLM class oxidoreductase, partial [Acidimicrobiales bacterium]
HYPEVAEVAEANGFESVWMPEHLIFPAEMTPNYSYTPDGYPPMHTDTPTFDPWVVLGGVATRTTTIRLATGVFILPLRHPIMAARSVVTLDRMSGGRVVMGIGVGWLPDEFEIVGEDFHNRGNRTDEMMTIMRRLWTDETIEFHGDYYDIPPVRFAPKPVNKKTGIPIIVGGTSPGALRRAGILGDGWVHHVQVHASLYKGEMNPGINDADFTELEEHLTDIHRHRDESDRADESFEVVAGMGATLGNIHRSEELGVTTYLAGPSAAGLMGTKDEFIDWIKRFADDVLTRV